MSCFISYVRLASGSEETFNLVRSRVLALYPKVDPIPLHRRRRRPSSAKPGMTFGNAKNLQKAIQRKRLFFL